MIILPTRRRLERKRDALYTKLDVIIHHASIHQVEDIMRKIHDINLRLRTYFKRGREPEEIFEDDDTTQDTTQGEDQPTIEDLAQIEAEVNEGKIQI